MSVVSVKLIRSRQLSVTAKEVKGKRTFLVRCSDRLADDADTAIAGVAAAGYPRMSAWSAEHGRCLARDVSADERNDAPKDGGTLYEVSLDYSTQDGDGNGDSEQQEEDPTDRPMQIRLSFDSMEESVTKHKDDAPTAEDARGNAVTVSPYYATHWKGAIVNSAGSPIPITETYRDPCISVTKHVRTNDFARLWRLLTTYVDAVNSTAFTLSYRGQSLAVDAKTCWLADVTSEPNVETLSDGREVQYETVNLTLRCRRDGWRRNLLDQGKCAFVGDDPNPNKPAPPIRDENGDPVQEPVLLNGRGKKLLDVDAPVFLKFRTKDEKNFQTLLSFLS